jgi:hypothetical protein
MPKNSASPWTGDPACQPREYITLCDILTVGTNSQPGDTTNSTSYTLGSLCETGATMCDTAGRLVLRRYNQRFTVFLAQPFDRLP